MERVSTAGNYASLLANLMDAQQSQATFGAQVATQKKASDLKGFATSADTLTSMNTVHARLQTYQDQNTVIADRLASQDSALNQVTDAAGAIRQAMADAIASGHGDTLMQQVQAQMGIAVDGMNARYNGEYLFAGGQVNTKPVDVSSLSDLTDPAPPAAALDPTTMFNNDNYKQQNKLDDSTTVTSGVLASDIGTPMLQALHDLQNSGLGPFTGTLTQAQQTFLQNELSRWDTIRQNLTSLTAANGLVQQQVDNSKQNVVSQSDTLTGMIGDITDADMAQAASNLQMAQMAVQAAAHVYQTLQTSSLLSILPAQ
jgi:flagellar hook-associated protein 3 FlgL